ncbi:MAG: c-type cytochrome biogenesis protein CcmI [Burkholderiales bacterium]|nr:c-type cytochrome biogenesis protein CcmI [Burkholderiales bacterium]
MSQLAFWSTVALLLAGALLFVLPPLLRPGARLQTGPSPLVAYRDELAQLDAELAQGTLLPSQHARALEELHGRVVEEVGDPTDPAPLTSDRRAPLASVLVVALLLPAGALGLYAAIGKPAALVPVTQSAPSAANAPHTMSREQMEDMVERLAEKLKAQPNDADGWHMLARSYVAFGRLPEAAKAYDRAAQLSPRDPQVLADFADALAMVNGKSLEGRPSELVAAALQLDAKHPKALSLAGTAAFNRGDFATAIAMWRRLQAVLPPGSDAARSVAGSIAQAEAGARNAGDKPAPAAATAAAGPPAFVEGQVHIADALKAQAAAPGSTLFVFARALQGPRMPLAIIRVPAEGFPAKFRLDDTMAMSPQFALSSQQQVVLGARLSRTGNATPQAGDLMGTLGPVKLGAQGLTITIDEVVK